MDEWQVDTIKGPSRPADRATCSLSRLFEMKPCYESEDGIEHARLLGWRTLLHVVLARGSCG